LFKLLQDRTDVAPREDVAGQQKHGEAIDRGQRRPRDHVGRARPDGTHAGEGPEAIAHLRVSGGDVNGGLLVLRVDISQLRILQQCLADPRDAAVPEDAKAAREKGLAPTVPFDVLVEEKLDDGLGRGEAMGFHNGAME